MMLGKAKFISSFIFIFIQFALCGQSSTELLEKRYDAYRNELATQNFDNAITFFDSVFKKNAPMDQVKKGLNEVITSDKFTLEVIYSDIKNISDILSSGKEKYCYFDYHASYHYYLDKKLPKKEKERLKSIFREREENNYVFNKKDQEVILNKNRRTIAIERSGVWYFFPYKKALNPYLHIFLPQEIIDGFNFKD